MQRAARTCKETDSQESLSQGQTQSSFTRPLNSIRGSRPWWLTGPWESSPSHILYPSTTFGSTLDHSLPASLPQNHSMRPLEFSWPSSVKAGYSTCNALSYADSTRPSTLQNSGQTLATLQGLSLPSEGRCPLCLSLTLNYTLSSSLWMLLANW